MIPLKMTITDWGPFKGTQTFTFPDQPGLYFLWGRNEVDSRLGSNGAGKSRIWEALCWVLFGKTSRGLKAGDIANWDVSKAASVTLTYLPDSGQDPCIITRSWSPNAWTWVDSFGEKHDLAKDETNPVLDDLKLSFQAFLNVVLMAQEGVMFLDLKADAKAALFGEIMGLDRWLDASQRASKKAAEEDVKCRRLDREVASLSGQLAQLEDRPLRQMSADWERNRNAQLDQLEAAEDVALGKLAAAKDRAQRDRQLEGDARDQVKLRHAALQELKLQRQDLDQAVAKANRALIEAQAKARSLEDHARFLRDHDHCPTCDQDLDPRTKAANLKRALRSLDELPLEALEDALVDAKSARAKLESRIDGQDQQLRHGQQALDDAIHKGRQVERDIALLTRDLDDLDDRIEAKENESNPYAQMLADSSTKADDLQRQIKGARQLLEDAESRYRLFTAWVKWFKEIRLSEIAYALTQLEIEVNNELSTLGLTSWALKFEVDRETKSGSIQRGFNVTVISPHNPRPVPWESWSGGEAQRLRLAAQCGLSNLIRNSLGVTIAIEAWDEPTDGMSPQGINDLLLSLAARAEAEQRQIWIIDHHSLSFGGFAGTSGVIKTPAGSIFDQSGLILEE